MLKFLLARLAEPSTWVGLSLHAATVQTAVQTHNAGAIVAAVAGLVAVVVPEQSPAN
jgi:hypothetical protein